MHDKRIEKPDTNSENGWDQIIRSVETEIENLKRSAAKIDRLERELEVLRAIKKHGIPCNPSARENLEF